MAAKPDPTRHEGDIFFLRLVASAVYFVTDVTQEATDAGYWILDTGCWILDQRVGSLSRVCRP